MKEKVVAIHQPNFMPWPIFWHKFYNCTDFVVLIDAVYSHGGYVNRCKLGDNWLTVPVKRAGRLGQLISEVELDDSNLWVGKHKERIFGRYGKFDDRFLNSLNFIYANPGNLLAGFNMRVLNAMIRKFGRQGPRIHFDWSFKEPGTGTDRIVNICRALQADAYLSGASGPEYMEVWKFDRPGIDFRIQNRCFDIENIPCTMDLLMDNPRTSYDFVREEVAKVIKYGGSN